MPSGLRESPIAVVPKPLAVGLNLEDLAMEGLSRVVESSQR